MTNENASQREGPAPSRKISTDNAVLHFINGESANNDTTPRKEGRRAIFGQYWSRVSNGSPDVGQEGGASAPQLITCPQPRLSPPEPDIRAFTPPEHHRPSLSRRFSPIDNFLSDTAISENRLLPTVPSPLRRYCSDGILSGGVYPLVSPRSILRPSSYKSPKNKEYPIDTDQPSLTELPERSVVSPAQSEAQVDPIPKTISRQAVPWAFTNSPAIKPRNRMGLNLDMIPHLDLDNSEDSSEQRIVQFDPRITVTEFEEPMERQWFTDTELEAFRIEASVLVRRFMRSNPQVAEAFRHARRDPVTGRLRYRAMYTNPAFSVNESKLIPADDSDGMKDLVELEVKQVLIVDPNNAILTLMRKSLKEIFPQANVVPLQSGEDALRRITTGQDAFDIMVVEQRLTRRQRITSVGSDHEYQHPERGTQIEGLGGTKTLSGCDILRTVSQLQHDNGTTTGYALSGSQPRCELSSDATPLSNSSPVSLMIGVSMYPDEDRPTMIASGADIVWGKPPPKMDRQLRNELLSALLEKRHASSLLTNTHRT